MAFGKSSTFGRARSSAFRLPPIIALDGTVEDGQAPNPARQSQSDLLARPRAFKAGDRKNEMMSIIIKDLSPTDKEDLAAYYSAKRDFRGQDPQSMSRVCRGRSAPATK
jgi:cytochrome c553